MWVEVSSTTSGSQVTKNYRYNSGAAPPPYPPQMPLPLPLLSPAAPASCECRCGGGDCAHAVPGGPREVFAGYGPTGLPRFADLGQFLLERGDPRVDRLFAEPPALLAHTVPGEDLARGVLDAFRDQTTGFRLHGQVVAGWYRVTDPATGGREPLAVTLQVVSTRAPARDSAAARQENAVPGGRDSAPEG